MPTRYEILPIPARMSHTELYAAGPIQIGVEYRLLNEELIAEEYGENARGKFGDAPPEELGDQIDEDGVSIHVFGDSAEREYLRFDCFEDFPHYHYLDPVAGHQTVYTYDVVADGPMHAWALERIERRLPEMLRAAGAEELAASIDSAALARVLPEVSRAVDRAREAGRPLPANTEAAAAVAAAS